MKLTFLTCVLLLFVSVSSAQDAPSPLTSPVTREMASGDIHEYTIKATGGDLISGTLELRGLAGLVEFRDAQHRTLRTFYVFDARPSQKLPIGFIAPVDGEYQVQVKAYDGFTGGR